MTIYYWYEIQSIYLIYNRYNIQNWSPRSKHEQNILVAVEESMLRLNCNTMALITV